MSKNENSKKWNKLMLDYFDWNNDGETNEVVEELEELPDDQVENSLSLDELKEKFGIDIENDETRDAEPLLD